MTDKLAGLIGLCRKSGNLICGATAVETVIKNKKSYIVLIADDSGESIRKKIINLCTTYQAEYRIVKNKEWLGNATGLDDKAVVAVINKDFADGIIKLI